MPETKSKYRIWEPLWLSLATVIGMFAGAKMVSSGSSQPKGISISNSKYSGRQVEEIIRFLETKYVGKVSTDSMVDHAIEAVMSGLDPHTHYFPPDQMDELEERTSGHYVGIGVEIAFINDSLVVLYPKKDSPAEHAGINPGDYILAVDDVRIPQDTLDHNEILSLIKGNKGTKVKLLIKPMLSGTEKTIEVVRQEIKVPSVITGYMIDTSIAYIKVEHFTNSTYKDFMDQWERLYTHHNARHLILDLRDNPGGYLKESVNMLSQIFPEEGKLLVYTEGMHERKVEYKSTGKIFFPVEHVCVLINEGSASASEIIAGCIQDQDRGVVIGTRSFGKGLVQEEFNLSNGGKLRMTVSNYYTPSGRSIQKAYDNGSFIDTNIVFKTTSGRTVHAGGGIIPDIEVRDNINWKKPGMMQWMDIISEYAIRYNLEHYDGKIVPIDQIPAIHMTLPSSEEILHDIDTLAARRSKPAQLDTLLALRRDHEEDFLRIAQSTLIAYRTGEEGWYIAFNEKDPVIQKATEVVKLDLMMALKNNE
ncbi:MAG TPA: S41 family peptidase [Saprospiraceae bacterium]|nr:S41 family peptidase [Saprospiraceae bacterium]